MENIKYATQKDTQKQKYVRAAARIGKAKDEDEDAEILWQPPKEEEREGIMPSGERRNAKTVLSHWDCLIQ